MCITISFPVVGIMVSVGIDVYVGTCVRVKKSKCLWMSDTRGSLSEIKRKETLRC